MEVSPCKDFLAKLGVRHGQVLLMFSGLLASYMNRINLSVGIVAMTDPDTNPNFETIPLTVTQIGSISGAFFWGYAVSNLVGGVLATRWGPRRVMTAATVVFSLFTFAMPLAALKGGFTAIYAARILQGLAQGSMYPSVHTHMSKWCVPKERGTMFAIAQSGAQFGTVIIMIASGFLADGIGGWPSIFYFTGKNLSFSELAKGVITGGGTGGILAAGLCGIGWAILCYILVRDSPASHSGISLEERNYIETNLEGSSSRSTKLPIPWLQILTSLPFWAVAISHVAYNWAFWTLLTLTPTYLNGVYNFSISKNGILSSLPYLLMFIFTIVFSFISDLLSKRNLASPNTIRKSTNTIAFWGGGLFLFLLGYVAQSSNVTLICLCLAAGLAGGVYTGFFGNHIDLSPNFSGVLMGITSSLGNVGSILAPTLAGVIVTENSNVYEWRTVFLVTGAIYCFGNAVFLIFGSTEIQPWNHPTFNKSNQGKKP